MKTLLIALTSVVLLVACSNSSNGKNGAVGAEMIGTYTSACFYNAPASQGNGFPIYTISKMSFNAKQEGLNHFELYDDAACTNQLMSGEMEMTYKVDRVIGKVKVLQMDQYDPVDPANNLTFWLPVYDAGSLGFYADVDPIDGNSGPYFSNPSDAQIQDFLDNPTTDGILFSKQ